MPSTPALTAQYVRDHLGSRYARFDREEQELHLSLLGAVQGLNYLALNVQSLDSDLWRITVCAPDHVGILSTIAGHLAATGLDIVNASIFTVSSRALDVLDVRSPAAANDAFWGRFEDELSALLRLVVRGDEAAAREQIMDRIALLPPADSREAHLYPVDIDVDNEADEQATVLRIHSADVRGFLFAFANALTLLNLNILGAEVRTVGAEIQDAFWLVDRRGQKLTDTERVHELRVAAALIKQFTFLLPRAANPAQALRQFYGLVSQMLTRPDWTREISGLESPETLLTLADVLGVSRFLWEDFLRMQHENLFPVLLGAGELEERRTMADLWYELDAALRAASGMDQKTDSLTRFKDREMFRIDLRHITGRMDFTAFSAELSDLAEVIVNGAARIAWEEVEPRHGRPMLADGKPCSWCIGALGKFGGREMGFGSDIELLFLYEGDGRTTGPEQTETPWFFEEFVRLFLAALATRREGVFEVDLRLRPYGSAGPTATSLAAFREYYSPGGGAQQFERMALVKLRPLSAGDPGLGERMVAARNAFVYSGLPLDVDNILHLRRRQATELAALGTVNAKYSHGGLSDVEYFVQACQIQAGREAGRFRVSNTLEAVSALSEAGRLDAATAQRLRETYGFLRRLIDALRVVRGNAKDLAVPPEDSREFAYLARRLRYPSPSPLAEDIAAAMTFAKGLWGAHSWTGAKTNGPG